MRLTNTGVLQQFKQSHPDAANVVEAWRAEAIKGKWVTPLSIKDRYPKASIIDSSNVIFDIRGGRYRLWVKVAYQSGVIMIKKAGTHEEYDKWDIK